MSESSQKDLYFVAFKLFLRNKEKLLITHDIFGSWDLPGGRIKKDEFMASTESIIDRKMIEELGKDVKYLLKEPKIFFRVERNEAGLGGKLVRIFAVGYEADYLGGEIQLGDHHDKMEWVDVNSFDPAEYFTGGWLTGVQDYLRKESFGEVEK